MHLQLEEGRASIKHTHTHFQATAQAWPKTLTYRNVFPTEYCVGSM